MGWEKISGEGIKSQQKKKIGHGKIEMKREGRGSETRIREVTMMRGGMGRASNKQPLQKCRTKTEHSRKRLVTKNKAKERHSKSRKEFGGEREVRDRGQGPLGILGPG